MDLNAGLVAGSHIKNELILIRHRPEVFVNQSQQFGGKICLICGDDIGHMADGELFVACNECAFPICRTCYEYERHEGNQVCPQCQTRFKRLKTFPRVSGDEDEDDIDDLENEFKFTRKEQSSQHLEDTMSPKIFGYQVPLLTDGTTIDNVSPEPQTAVITHAVSESEGSNRLLFTHSRAPEVALDSIDFSKALSSSSFSSLSWKERMDSWKNQQAYLQATEHGKGRIDLDDDNEEPVLPLMDEARLPLSRKVLFPSSQINPYRVLICIRLLVLGFFFHYRITHPVKDAHALWLVSVICEICFAISWILGQFSKSFPVDRETYLDRLSLRYEKEGKPSELSAVDIFVTTLDSVKESPLITANTILSILAVDYPVDKVSCYISDDEAAILTFEALSETLEFAHKWVPFCRKFNIEPRAPEPYFAENFDYLKDKVLPEFIKERRSMKREYAEFKVRMNGLVGKAQRVPEGEWVMQDGTPWPGNNAKDHPGMIQVFRGQIGECDVGVNELPRLIYVSKEKRPGFSSHKKAGAMNAMVRVSALLTNAPYLLNLNSDCYISNSKALREAMCFLMDPLRGKNICYVQFPLRFDAINGHNRYTNPSTIFFDINMKGLDGIQGPMYAGTGCVFRRHAFYGYDAPKTTNLHGRIHDCCPDWCFHGSCCSARNRKERKLASTVNKNKESHEETARILPESFTEGDGNEVLERKLEKKFGQSHLFAASTLLDNGETVTVGSSSLLKEAIHVISCGYEEKTDWGKEVGWIYGSEREDILTGFKMHCNGWRSIYCNPNRSAFTSSSLTNLSNYLHQVQREALGSVEIFLSRHCPLLYGYGKHLKFLQRLAYVDAAVYPWTSIPLAVYCTLPAVCLLTGKFVTPEFTTEANFWFMSLLICIFVTTMLEMRLSGIGITDWWRSNQFWVIEGVSARLFAVFQGLAKVLTGMDTRFSAYSEAGDDYQELSGRYTFEWTALFIPPTTLLVMNMIGVVAGISEEIANGGESLGLLFGKLIFAIWVIGHLYPFLKGLLGRQNRTPTIVIVWSILIASVFSIMWVRVDPFLRTSGEPLLEECGLNCE